MARNTLKNRKSKMNFFLRNTDRNPALVDHIVQKVSKISNLKRGGKAANANAKSA